jgi:hypothetical protein
LGAARSERAVLRRRAVIVISSCALDTAPSIEDHLAMMDAAIVPGLS